MNPGVLKYDLNVNFVSVNERYDRARNYFGGGV